MHGRPTGRPAGRPADPSDRMSHGLRSLELMSLGLMSLGLMSLGLIRSEGSAGQPAVYELIHPTGGKKVAKNESKNGVK